MTLVTGTYARPDGSIPQGHVRFTLTPAAVDVDGAQRTHGWVDAIVDESGSISVDLIPDSDLVVDGVAMYRVHEHVGSIDREWFLYLEDDVDVDLPSRYPGDEYAPGAVLPVPGPPGSSLHADLTDITPDDHHTRYTDAEAVAAVGPMPPDQTYLHADLTDIAPDDHHTRYTDAEAITAVGPVPEVLDDLIDVTVPAPAPNDRLAWDEELQQWVPMRSQSGLGVVELAYKWEDVPTTLPAPRFVSGDESDAAITRTLFFNKLGDGGVDYSLFLQEVGEGDWLNLHDKKDTSKSESYDVTGPAVLNGDIFEVPVTFYEQGTALTDGERLRVFWRQGGDQIRNLPDLQDVTITDPKTGETLTYVNGEWVNVRSGEDILTEAQWHVDAGRLTADGGGLTDLSGGGNDLVFTPGSEPVVLPHDGEDYVHVPTGDSLNRIVCGSGPTAPSTATVDLEVSVEYTIGQAGFLALSGGYSGGGVQVLASGLIGVLFHGGSVTTSVPMPVDGQRHTISAAMTTTSWELFIDGATRDSGTWTVTTGGGAITMYLPGTAAWTTLDYFAASFVYDDDAAFILDPANANADQTLITNTGSAGGDWTIERADTGLKTVVVDRPKLLFGTALSAATGSAVDATGTRIDVQGPTVAASAHDGGVVTISADQELSASTVFDRALTDDEITLVSAELQSGVGPAAGPVAHGDLTGLGADDHPHYLTEARAGALYIPAPAAPVEGAHLIYRAGQWVAEVVPQ